VTAIVRKIFNCWACDNWHEIFLRSCDGESCRLARFCREAATASQRASRVCHSLPPVQSLTAITQSSNQSFRLPIIIIFSPSWSAFAVQTPQPAFCGAVAGPAAMPSSETGRWWSILTYTPMIKFLQRLGRDDASTDSIRCAQTAESDATQARFSHISDADVFIYFLLTFHFSQPWTGCADAASWEFLSASWAQLVLCCTVGLCHVQLCSLVSHETLAHVMSRTVDRLLRHARELVPFVVWPASGRLRCYIAR